MKMIDLISNNEFKQIENWLDDIGEFDDEIRKEVIESCKEEDDCKEYYLGRANEYTR